jgi:hypothetical protein
MDEDFTTMADSDGVSIHSGFPNPALDGRSRGRPLALDLNQLLIERPSSTYLFRISGHTWADQGVYDGDVAIVDRAQRSDMRDLVITWRANGFALCRRRQLSDEDESLGVVTAIIHRFTGV